MIQPILDAVLYALSLTFILISHKQLLTLKEGEYHSLVIEKIYNSPQSMDG